MSTLLHRFALILVVLIIILSVACDGEEPISAPILVHNAVVKNVSFMYPEGLYDRTSEFGAIPAMQPTMIETGFEVGVWADHEESLLLFVGISDPLPSTDGQKMSDATTRQKAMNITPGLLNIVENPDITSQKETMIGDIWGWETEFSGKNDNADTVGYMLIAFSDSALLVLVCVGYEEDSAYVETIYMAVKESFVIY